MDPFQKEIVTNGAKQAEEREKTEEEIRAIRRKLRRKYRINSLLKYLLFIGIFLVFVLLGTTELKHESFWDAFGKSFYYTIISFYVVYLILRWIEKNF